MVPTTSLTRIRQRWGAARFRRIFQRTVEACVAAGIAKGEVVHIDSSLVRADVSWDAIARRHVEAVAAANGDAAASDGSSDQDAAGDGCAPRAAGQTRVVCTSDPEATLATDHRARRCAPAYKQHTAVDDHASVVLDVEVIRKRITASLRATATAAFLKPLRAASRTPQLFRAEKRSTLDRSATAAS